MENLRKLYGINLCEPNAIVDFDAFGKEVRLTPEMFASYEEFVEQKAMHDADLHYALKQYRLADKYSIPIDLASLDRLMDPESNNSQEQDIDFVKLDYILKRCLNPKQYLRLMMYMSARRERDSAESEGVSQIAISQSISAALRKIRQYLSEKQIFL